MESCAELCVGGKKERQNVGDCSPQTESQLCGDPQQHGIGATLDREALRRYMFTYTARETAEAGLMFYRARWMAASIGRFVSEDPASVHINRYSYVSNMPTNSTDPSGMVRLIIVPPSVHFLPEEVVRGLCKGGPACTFAPIEADCECSFNGCVWRPKVTILLIGDMLISNTTVDDPMEATPGMMYAHEMTHWAIARGYAEQLAMEGASTEANFVGPKWFCEIGCSMFRFVREFWFRFEFKEQRDYDEDYFN